MTAYEVRISDWSSDVCSSDLAQDEDLQVAESLILSLPKHEGRDAASWRRTLVPEVYVLQGLLDLQVLDQRDGRLKVVALLAGDAQFVALDSRLDLQLAALDPLGNLLGDLLVDALFERADLTHHVSRCLFSIGRAWCRER